MGGDLPIWRNPEAVRSSVVASRPYWREADVPDVINHVDAERRPDLFAFAIERRMRNGRLFETSHLMRFPKASGGVRVMTCLDPVDDLAYRHAAGRVVRRIFATLDTHVDSSRPLLADESWRIESWRVARRRHVGRVAAERLARQWDGVGKLDVRSHYPTVSLRQLRTVLHSAACHDNAVRDLVKLLESLQDRSGCSGLAIGPEASALLGTIALAPLDRMLLGERVTFLRWVDDLLLFVDAEERYEELKARAGWQLALGDQGLNLDKCTYERFGDGQVTGFEDPYGGWEATSGGWSANPGAELSKLAEAREPRGISQLLGQLRHDGDSSGIETAVSDPWLIDNFPTQVGAYLRRVRDDIADWQPVVSMVFRDTTDNNVAGQLRLTRLLKRPQIGAELGSELFARGKALDRKRYAPLANELLAAAGRGQERLKIRQRRGAEHALEFTDLNAKRALLDCCRRDKAVPGVRSTLRQLGRVEPDLGALLDLIDA